jgi:cyclase
MRILSVAITTCLLGPTAVAAGAPLAIRQIAPNFTLEQLTPNIYAFVSNNTTHAWEDGNTTVIIGDDGVAVIDAPATYLSKRHLAEIRKLTHKPIRYVINTHFHRDHVLGDYVYKDASPSVLIVQQDVTAALADRRDPEAVDALKGKRGEALMQRLKDAAEKSVDPDGKPLSGYDLDRAKRSYEEFVPVYHDAQAARYVPADITFDSTMTLKLGSIELQLMHLPGHTLGDTVVWLPGEKILITGDLVIAPVPYGGPDHYEEWIASLSRLIAFDATAIVPGHGEVQFSRDYMVLERDLLQSLMDQAVSAAKHGDSLEVFERTLDLSSFEARLVHGDPELQWGWDNYFFGRTNHALAIRAYRTARGER